MTETSGNKIPSVAVLYICTGKYRRFFAGFYESARRYFLHDVARVSYIVFTDDMKLTDADDVEFIFRDCQGFPMDSLMRYDLFLQAADRLKTFDYIFFFNANMRMVAPIGKEILPEHLTAVIHPGYYNKPVWRYPYERDRRSSAFIPAHEKGYHYYMGSVNGGRTDDFLALARTCNQHIKEDLKRGIVAKYHDESHLNHYLRYHDCTPLSPAYAYIEGKELPFEPKILLLDKVLIDPYFNKGRDHSLAGRFKKGMGIVIDAIKWYL
jgi:hypothetical protein